MKGRRPLYLMLVGGVSRRWKAYDTRPLKMGEGWSECRKVGDFKSPNLYEIHRTIGLSITAGPTIHDETHVVVGRR